MMATRQPIRMRVLLSSTLCLGSPSVGEETMDRLRSRELVCMFGLVLYVSIKFEGLCNTKKQ